ncbi:MAG: class I SAM-dependent methyltransferase [Aliiglaciecola sp.]
MRKLNYLVVVTLFFTGIASANSYQEILQNSDRWQQDLKDDDRRKPAQVMSFFQVKPGMKVLDVFSGAGYFTEVTSFIVGPTGSIDAHNNQAYVDYIGKDKLLARYKDNRLKNVNLINQEANDLSLCEGCYDRILMVLTFHDLYYVDVANGWNKIDAPVFMQKIKRSLKPGGKLGIIDHNAETGANINVAQSLHRIDPDLIKQKMQKWGFELEAEADFHSNSEDNRSLPMWDDSVRGKTDKSVLRFVIAKQ